MSGLLIPLLFALTDTPALVVLAHQKPVFGVFFSPNGRTLLSAGDDGFVRVWDLVAKRQTRHWKAHETGIVTLAQSADGKTLATGGRDGTVRLWDLTTGKEKGKYEGLKGDVESLSLSADGTILVASSSGRMGTFRTSSQGKNFT